MTDGNISIEEDTELRDLVAQTLENNGVLAKVRAELRASVFLALEEQESVMNTKPLLNKTVKQYLANTEGRLLFSLVREFLEYFGLDYTISVYDPETYAGKEYNYAGRSKLCEELGIVSSEPLLGEILRTHARRSFNNSEKQPLLNFQNEDDGNGNMATKMHNTSSDMCNETYDEMTPKILHKDSVSLSNDNNDSSEKLESMSEAALKVPINVTITDKKKSITNNQTFNNVLIDTSSCELQKNNSLRKNDNTNLEDVTDTHRVDGNKENNDVRFSKFSMNLDADNVNVESEKQSLNKTEPLIKFDETIIDEVQPNQNEKDASKQKGINNTELHNANNVQNKKIITDKSLGKTMFFDEIIIDGKKEKVGANHKSESSLLGDLPPLTTKVTSIFSDLPSFNTKKTDINDLKELMDIGLASEGIDNYEEDFISSASGSANEQSPSKSPDKCESPNKSRYKKEERHQSVRSDDISEEIEGIDEILSSTSCLENVPAAKSISNITVDVVTDYIQDV
ncbi:uncharacterized protein LOC107227747 isoform X1 [Neodiprion lecontei]|uniref:Uncharacterized protein LOC107227747 isoform X1 n=1 Tax=Neodiprion lecontei TaxID=441921 RepID=A0ABM3GQA7_NEOLC|nr:uncharacterized protein LOC107227747 isoform X1 [Neodiprion lecontei]